MPITYDSGAQGDNTGVSTLTVSHVLGAAGNNRMAVVGLITHCSSALFVNYVRYNGVGMTYLQFQTSGDGLLLAQLWCMPDAALPAAGTYNVVANFDKNADNGCMMFVTSWYGMRQTNPSPLLKTFADGVTSLSVADYRTRASLSRSIAIVGNNVNQQVSASGTHNQSIIRGNRATIGGGQFRLAPPTVGTYTFGYTVPAAADMVMCYAEFMPADWNAVLESRPMQRGFNTAFNLGFPGPY